MWKSYLIKFEHIYLNSRIVNGYELGECVRKSSVVIPYLCEKPIDKSVQVRKEQTPFV